MNFCPQEMEGYGAQGLVSFGRFSNLDVVLDLLPYKSLSDIFGDTN